MAERYVLGPRGAEFVRKHLGAGVDESAPSSDSSTVVRPRSWVKPISLIANGLYSGVVGLIDGNGGETILGSCRVKETNGGTLALDKWVEGSRTGDTASGIPQFLATGAPALPSVWTMTRGIYSPVGNSAVSVVIQSVPELQTMVGTFFAQVKVSQSAPLQVAIRAINPSGPSPPLFASNLRFYSDPAPPVGWLELAMPFVIFNNVLQRCFIVAELLNGTGSGWHGFATFHNYHSRWLIRPGDFSSAASFP